MIFSVPSALGVVTPALLLFAAVDITVYHNGFHGDLNETFFVGDVDEEAKKLVQTTYECLMQAIDSGRSACVTAVTSARSFSAAELPRRWAAGPLGGEVQHRI